MKQEYTLDEKNLEKTQEYNWANSAQTVTWAHDQTGDAGFLRQQLCLLHHCTILLNIKSSYNYLTLNLYWKRI